MDSCCEESTIDADNATTNYLSTHGMFNLDRLRLFATDNRAATAALVVGTTYLGYRLLSHCRASCRLRSAVNVRRDEQQLNFERVTKFYEELSVGEANEILSWSYGDLKEKLAGGAVSCVEVLRAYQRKAMEVTTTTNCVCLFIEAAIQRAEELDEKAKDPNYERPPLFGVPVSVKECVAVKDMDITLGYAQDLFLPSKDHSVMVKNLLHLGAVPFVQTNNPLSLLTWGCTNAIYGRTTHPMDSSRVPGGSSGGEGALVSAGGSILGIGSDIGGSIRIPSSFCGLAGFKPSVERFSHINAPGGIPGRCKIIANEGPMAKDINSCIDFLKFTWSESFLFDADPYVPPVYWDELLFSSTEPLTIGYYTHDGFLTPAPAYVRAVEESVQYLQSAGHKLVEFEVPRAADTFRLLLASVSADGGYFLAEKMAKDIVPDDCNYGFIGRNMSPFFQKLLRPLIPWPRLRNLLGVMPANMNEMRQVNADIDVYRREFWKLLQEQHIDVLICPAMIMYPPPPHVPVSIPPATSYTSLYNVLDYPAGVVPVTRVNAKDERALEDYPETDPYDKLIKKVCRNMAGFPIAVQVVSHPFREETALRVLKELQDNIGMQQSEPPV